jgi:hypothetical protein
MIWAAARWHEGPAVSTTSPGSPTFVAPPSILDRIKSAVSEQIAMVRDVVRDMAWGQCFVLACAGFAPGDALLGRSAESAQPSAGVLARRDATHGCARG